MSESNKLPVTVCILCKNESDRLERCLSQLGGFAEVIVLDSGSTDGSQEIVRRHGFHLRESDWKGFSESRRELFSLAGQPWIFWLDADEVVTAALQSELHDTFFKGIPEDIDGFRVNRMVCFEGQWVRHGSWFPDWNLRIFRSDKWRIEEKKVHESVTVPGAIRGLQSIMEHHSFRSWEDLVQRTERYVGLWIEEKSEQGKRGGACKGAARATVAFLKSYLVKAGFLDGALGYRIARIKAWETYRKYKGLSEVSSKKPQGT